jgi:murein DD-endopeptidase MepM/ murein hydrolase activator NlpD
MKIVLYLCPVWLFGPLIFLSLRGAADQPGENNGGSDGIISILSGQTEQVVVDTVARNETLSDIFLAHEISYSELLEVLKASKGIFNLNRLQSGSLVKMAFNEERRFSRLEYEIDDRRLLLVDVHRPDSVTAWIDEVDYQYRSRLVNGEIRSSLYQALQDNNEHMEIAYMLSEIFAWQIDFSTDLRKGDYFRAIVEEYRGRDEKTKLNTILAAEFYNNGKLYQAFRYVDPDGRVDYYDGTGTSVRRKFLKSPLKYKRISSRFSRRRFHPILKIYRPHLGVDYAAPSGTPVVSVGDGEVVLAGWKGGFGNCVKVRHNGIYQTLYGHLRGFARGIRRGKRVKQGQVIGYVGSTGLSTGPHLDFRLTVRGKYVNPLTVNLPAADPVKKAYRDEFRNCDTPARTLVQAPLSFRRSIILSRLDFISFTK